MELEHIGIAARSIAEALAFWQDALGLEHLQTEEVEEQRVRVAMLPLGGTRIELLEATGPDSPIAKFIEKRGPGIHHIAIGVSDLRAVLKRLRESGVRLIDDEPRRGADGTLIAFIHPSAAGGVLVELVERRSA